METLDIYKTLAKLSKLNESEIAKLNNYYIFPQSYTMLVRIRMPYEAPTQMEERLPTDKKSPSRVMLHTVPPIAPNSSATSASLVGAKAGSEPTFG